MAQLAERIKINDGTLREGEQTYGVVFSNREKMRIARYLDEIGVDMIEVGFPDEPGYEREYIKELVEEKRRGRINALLMGWHRPIVEEIKSSVELGLDAVAISISTSDIMIETKLRKSREWVIETTTKAIEYAKSQGLYVSCNAEDASRTDEEFLLQFVRSARDAGADRIRFCDTLGCLHPFRTKELVAMIMNEGIDVEMHCHNDLGMATANTLAGVKAVEEFPERTIWLGVTINGLGERAGNAPLEEVIMALKIAWGLDMGFRTSLLREACEYVALASGRYIPPWKPIVGENLFRHASGIHADGVIKNPRNYEIILPGETGEFERKIGISKHSGIAAVKYKYSLLGIHLSDEEARALLTILRKETVQLKRMPLDKELVEIYEDFKEGKLK
ncbi:MAG: homocitrate synthase family protein [bacterium]